MPDPRILAIMGSGETAPTMARVHRALFDRLGDGALRGAILDTPYGFQENADQLSARTLAFFATSVGHPMDVASYRSREVDPTIAATAVARLREARYVMAGPGSPSYALAHWSDGPIPELLAGKLATGGILTMASAAALTLGVVTLPVYEIYKVGREPHWLPGLDLLGRATGIRAAVVPHYDNAEGGNHDTRFCYMGERRLRRLEELLPDGTCILGVDGHTALVIDLDAGTATVMGLGGISVRVDGRTTTFGSGSTVTIETLASAAAGLPGLEARVSPAEPPPVSGRGAGDGDVTRRDPRDRVADAPASLVAAVDRALGAGDPGTAVGALLELHQVIEARLRSGEDSPELDAVTSTFRALLVTLGETMERAGDDQRRIVDPLVAALLDVRARARAAHDWATADVVRAHILDAGFEVRDGADTTLSRSPVWSPDARREPAKARPSPEAGPGRYPRSR